LKTRDIIFVHGWASGPYVWIHQVSYFKDTCRVHTPELLGYGNRRPAKGDIFSQTVNDLADFITANRLENVCLVGWSLGGMVSLKLTATLKDKIDRLVLIGTTARFVQSDDFKDAVPRDIVKRIHERMKNDFEGTLKWFYKFCFSPHERARGEFSEVVKLLGDFITPLNAQTLLSGLELLMELDIRHVLADITAPALIVHGADDRICPPQAADFLRKGLKGSSIRLLKRAGHAPFLTQPTQVNGLIEKFIAR
jgi:pimeloyl-[acyl-carrier protein] methyl ester esterase